MRQHLKPEQRVFVGVVAPIDRVLEAAKYIPREFSSKYGLRGIALRGFGMDSDLAQSTAAGFSRHLIKPIDVATLRATLAEMTSGA